MKKKYTQRGFTLLMAALVASVTLALGSSIFAIARKQITLSALGRESQFAFYAADTGAECALYWDLRYAAFSTSTPAAVPSCDGDVLNPTGREEEPPYTVSFQITAFEDADGISNTADDDGYCAEVTVAKDTENPYTIIHSNGYSVPCSIIGISDRALQRSVELRY